MEERRVGGQDGCLARHGRFCQRPLARLQIGPVWARSGRLFLLGELDSVLPLLSRADDVISPCLFCLPLPLSPVGGGEGVHGWQDGSDLVRTRMSDRTSIPESTGDQCSSCPRSQDGGKVELYALVCPFLHLAPQVDQVLHTGRIQVGNGGKVENDRSTPRFAQRIDVLDRLTLLGARVVPRSIPELDVAHVLASTSIRLDVVDNGRVDVRSVRVEERLFEPIDDDTLRRRFDLDGRVGDPTIPTERHVDVPNIGIRGRVFRPDPDTSEEVTPRTSDPEQQEDDRGGQRGVDTVLDRAEDRNDDGGGEDDPFERGDSPETVRLSRAGDQVGYGVDDQGRDSSVGDVYRA